MDFKLSYSYYNKRLVYNSSPKINGPEVQQTALISTVNGQKTIGGNK